MQFGGSYYSPLPVFSLEKFRLTRLGLAAGDDAGQAHRSLAYFPFSQGKGLWLHINESVLPVYTIRRIETLYEHTAIAMGTADARW
jgi:hypothetical protein